MNRTQLTVVGIVVAALLSGLAASGITLVVQNHLSQRDAKREVLARISDLPVVPYRQDQSPRPDFWGSDVRHHTTEDDTRWVNYSTRRFSSRSTAF